MRGAAVGDSGQGHPLLRLPPTPLLRSGAGGSAVAASSLPSPHPCTTQRTPRPGIPPEGPAPLQHPAPAAPAPLKCSHQVSPVPGHPLPKGDPPTLPRALALNPRSQHCRPAPGAPRARGSRRAPPRRQPSGRRVGLRWRLEAEAEPGRAPPRPPAHIGRPGGPLAPGACAVPGARGGPRRRALGVPGRGGKRGDRPAWLRGSHPVPRRRDATAALRAAPGPAGAGAAAAGARRRRGGRWVRAASRPGHPEHPRNAARGGWGSGGLAPGPPGHPLVLSPDYIQIAQCFEATRQRCCCLEQDGRRAREQLARVEAERAALEVKLKHARKQVEVEMKKRHRAEAELEKQERKLQLVFEILMREPWGSGVLSGEQCSVLSTLAGRCLGVALAQGRRSSVVDESCQSLLSHSDISYDCTEDDVGVDMTVVRTLKRKAQERQRVSLAPQIGPVVVAKRHRSSVAPHNTVSVPPVPPPAEVPADSLLPAAPLPCRRSRQGHRVSTHAELTTVWDTSKDPGSRALGRESHAKGSSVGQPVPASFPLPPQGLPPPQHQFTSKTVIRPEPCGVCGSRIRFGRAVIKCRQCQLLLHPKCREQCPIACTPQPYRHAWPCEGVLADFAPLTPPLVPTLVVQCVTEVETRGLTETGLYRVPGAEQQVREWKRRLLRAGGTLPALSSVADIHVVCGVLKDFLRGLKEPLVTFSLHPAFLQAADIPDDAACGTALRHVVSKLPPANRDTLAFLMLHLLRVSHSPDCKMDVLNLSRVFGPTLVGHGSANPTPLAIMEDTPRQCKVVARLLALPPDFWRGFVGMEKENPVQTLVPGDDREPFCPTTASEPKPGQLSPASTCCLPGTLRSCMGTAVQPQQGPAPKKVGRFFPSLV
ncbi:rac GTPase-activating protein 1-like isoform X2 [Falco rusticolus]|uniref:rac GTPase-activating protein 1-like isoform X2 n=1 Tax=Falco rusticolus TaxID=120794 RepID=UPI0018868922|nr:rac GTPase-activating protein 1-like isoform X2 [Falco rusticolus]